MCQTGNVVMSSPSLTKSLSHRPSAYIATYHLPASYSYRCDFMAENKTRNHYCFIKNILYNYGNRNQRKHWFIE